MRVHRFAIISGCGALIDSGVLATLVWRGGPIFWSSIIGASIGITFSFVFSQGLIFIHQHRFMWAKFLGYCVFQSLLIPVASVLVQVLAITLDNSGWLTLLLGGLLPGTLLELAFASVVAKGLCMPITLYINYLFMGWLLERQITFL
ncbi:GtrA-like protein [uncultured Gammaproteobacteria bacterium]